MAIGSDECVAGPERWRSELLRVFMDHPPIGIAVFDRSMHYLAINGPYREALGLGDRNIVGHSYYEVFPEIPERWRQMHRRCLAGATERSEADPWVRANGNLEWYRWEIQPWYEAADVVGGIVLFTENVTAQKRSENARAESEAAARRTAEILDKTMASIADVVIVVDAGERLLYVNEAGKAALGEHNCRIGSDDWKLASLGYSPDGVTPVDYSQRPLSRALRGEKVDNQELVVDLLARGGKPVSFIASARPIQNSAGEVEGAVVVGRDVTDLRATQDELRELQKMEAIGQLTGGIAHDFNNILTVITGTIETLIAGVSDRPLLSTIAQMINDAATRGAMLTKQLLAFARRQPLQPRASNVNALIMDAVGLLRPVLGENIEIEATLGEDVWPAMVDPTQFSMALLNLAINARDAMPNGGKVTFATDDVVVRNSAAGTIGALPSGEYVKIIVTDTGRGIPLGMRNKVFEPFFTTKPAGKGTGLGLSMVFGFVKQSHGHVELLSREGGTAFELYLPRSSEQAEAIPEHPPSTVVGGSETILVVEDDELVCRSVLIELQSLGYKVLQASDGQKALAMVDAGYEFALLFTDVFLPGALDGRQLAEEALRRRPGIKILYTSGYAEDVLVHNGRLDPGVSLLIKPYTKAELAGAIRHSLDG
jgi:PAS domain S-box-containing protein